MAWEETLWPCDGGKRGAINEEERKPGEGEGEDESGWPLRPTRLFFKLIGGICVFVASRADGSFIICSAGVAAASSGKSSDFFLLCGSVLLPRLLCRLIWGSRGDFRP